MVCGKNKSACYLLIFSIFISCTGDQLPDLDFRQEMRNFVTGISEYAKGQDSSFLVIPQNGIELITINGDENGSPHLPYLAAIDGNGQEDLFYGYSGDDQPTPEDENDYLSGFLDKAKEGGKVILVTDYCSAPANIDNSYTRNEAKGYISFAADHRELDNIPGYPATIPEDNNEMIDRLGKVNNFLYLINNENYPSKESFIYAVLSTNYDLLIMDLFFDGNSAFSALEISMLKEKANGGSRLVICYLSIGEAEDYRYYWQPGWKAGKPGWLDKENPDWDGNYKVNYWDPSWQQIIYGNDSSYVQKIINAGFDGVYLDIIDAFEYYE
jgi:cysteinyl-tRNA synthetase, unknown class